MANELITALLQLETVVGALATKDWAEGWADLRQVKLARALFEQKHPKQDPDQAVIGAPHGRPMQIVDGVYPIRQTMLPAWHIYLREAADMLSVIGDLDKVEVAPVVEAPALSAINPAAVADGKAAGGAQP